MANHITINWNASPTPVSGYNVYRGGADGNESSISLNNSPIVGTTFTDNTVFPGIVYSYSVTAVLNGIESVESIDIVAPIVPHAPSPVLLDLGAASGFGLLAATTITNVPGSSTFISGDIGLYPGTSVTGFGAPVQVSGSYHLADYVAGYAINSAQAAFTLGMNLVSGSVMPADIGGHRLVPGVYSVATSLAITGVLVLDAGSNPNAIWIFQIGSTLTTAAGNSNIVLLGGAQASNIFWLVGSSATLGTGTTFAGNIIAQASVTVGTTAAISGRIIALTGAITLDGNEAITFAPSILISLPPSPANIAPAPPSAPVGLAITSEA